MEQNRGLHQGLEKVNVTWKHWKIVTRKQHGSAIIEVESAEQADRIIEQGIIIAGTKMDCLKFQSKWDFKQCFNCLGYRHVSTHCAKRSKCEKCFEQHSTRDCQKEGTPLCVNCRTKGHSATDWNCPSRAKYVQRLEALRKQDTGKYGVAKTKSNPSNQAGTGSQPSTPAPNPPVTPPLTEIWSSSQRSVASTGSTISAEGGTEERPYTVVGNKRKSKKQAGKDKKGAKRRVGRPKAVAISQKNNLLSYQKSPIVKGINNPANAQKKGQAGQAGAQDGNRAGTKSNT